MDWRKFETKFNNNYDYLYNLDNEWKVVSKVSDEFDARIGEDEVFQGFVSDFVNYRQDFISSDREAAAFMMTYNGVYK